MKLLIDAGDAGLTLRKLADCAGMRLSNVQYYFKSRDDVLAAMVARYFEECTENLVHQMQQSEAKTVRERVHFLLLSGLSHGQEISDMCRAFREIWAISSRNATIDQCLLNYYRTFSDVIVDFTFGSNIDDSGRDKFKSLFIPFFEGYSITARSLPLQREEAAAMLTDLAMSFVVRKSD